MTKQAYTYKSAGVDVAEGDAFVDKIKPLAAATKRAGVMEGLGGFGCLFDLAQCNFKDPILVSSTDGVGTKLEIAQEMGVHHTVGIDLLAMCANDVVCQGAQPLFFLDYLATGKLESDVAAQVVAGISEGCQQSNCALIGGETAEMPGMYPEGVYDMAGCVVGAVERDLLLPRKDDIQAGDVILGMAADGFSNGHSLVRRIVKDFGHTWDTPAPFDGFETIGEAALLPNKIHVKSCVAAVATGKIKGFSHITGGGFDGNIPRCLPDNVVAEIDRSAWKVPALFNWLSEQGNVAEEEMFRTFNMGIGMVAVVAPDDADDIQKILEDHGETVCRLGRIHASEGSSSVRFV